MYCLIFTAFQEKKYSFKTVLNTRLFQTFNTAVIHTCMTSLSFFSVDQKITSFFVLYLDLHSAILQIKFCFQQLYYF